MVFVFFESLLSMDTTLFFKGHGIILIPVPVISITHWDLNKTANRGNPVVGCMNLTQSNRQSYYDGIRLLVRLSVMPLNANHGAGNRTFGGLALKAKLDANSQRMHPAGECAYNAQCSRYQKTSL